MASIAIIGGGLSGRFVLLNLLRLRPAGVDVVMIDRRDEVSVGPAYCSDATCLLLNVPAGRMGAFADDPGHFLEWSRQHGVPANPLDFLPRGLYRRYVLDLQRSLLQTQTARLRFRYVRAAATDVRISGAHPTIDVQDGESLQADKVVLGLGNFRPRDPALAKGAVLRSPRYVRDPWEPRVVERVSRDDAIVLIGTGQTAVDIAVALNEHGHRGRIVAISRHGALPLAHGRFDTYPSFYAEIRNSGRVLDICRTIRKHVRRAESMGIDKRAVIDSLRPDTQALWFALSTDEKRRFVRHVFRYWEIIRSRIPPQTEALIFAMMSEGRLAVVSGRIVDFAETDSALDVQYVGRGATKREVARAAFVINCAGPETDYDRIDDTLVANLLRRGTIRRGPANIGIDAQPGGAVIGRDGAASSILYTLGSTMKGVLWEVLAVPDIRVQAERLARVLLDDRATPATLASE